jgi:hypothetical protein
MRNSAVVLICNGVRSANSGVAHGSLAGLCGRLVDRPSQSSTCPLALKRLMDAVARCVKEKALSHSTQVSKSSVVVCNTRQASKHWRCAAIVGLLALFVAPQMVQASVQFSPLLEDTIQQASNVQGLAPSILRAFAAIESGGNPRARTGSYFGVYQLSHNEFRKYGGRGNIFDLSENTQAAARKLRAEADAFSRQYGRQPTATELYMLHQQGIAGTAMHIENPDGPAWQNMYRTSEGQKKGPAWARLAIWGNIPQDQRAQFPDGVDSVTSRQFMELWDRKLMRFGANQSAG